MIVALAALGLFAATLVGDEWQNNQKLSDGKEPTRAAFVPFGDAKSALGILPEGSTRQLTLDSDDAWRFCWSKDPDSRPKGFQAPDYDVSAWPTIKVPCSWQAMGANGTGGWGTALYSNVPYPFRTDAPGGSQVMLEPPKHFTNYDARNPVGAYRRDFDLPEGWRAAGDVFLKFDGVDSFFYLWVNGKYVGFSKDSRSPAEFNVTPYVKDGKNVVALEVYRYSDGAYFEDQDMFRLSGIFRHTWMISRPKKRIRDFHVTTTPVVPGEFGGAWDLKVRVRGEGLNWQAALYTFDGVLVQQKSVPHPASDFDVDLRLTAPRLWSAEEPNCYKLVLSNGKEFVSTLVGFRVSEMRAVNGVNRYYFNGQPIKLKGANRHETDPMFGHYVPACRQEQDIGQMKAANCNTVRNAHYPQDDYWYYLCNTRGLYVVDEANVETHGYGYGERSLSHQKSWEKTTVDRNLSMVRRNFNHSCVVIWSYGNEAGPGENFQAVEKAVKALDTTRPTHYERDWSVADMDGCQYPAVDWCWWKARQTNSKKPFYISEYAHNMANAMGNLKDYQDAIESSDVILGATIWDWVDQGLWLDKNGVRILAFGGDFGDQPNDGLFCMNGCVLSDRNLEPGYYEIFHVYQNYSVRATNDFARLVIRNKNYFADASDVTCHWTLLQNGVPAASGELALDGLRPQCEHVYDMPEAVAPLRAKAGIVALRLRFYRGDDEIANDQIDLPGQLPPAYRPVAGEVTCEEDDKSFAFTTKKLVIAFCKKTGMPYSIKKRGFFGDRELLKSPMRLDAYRSPSSNEVSFGVRLGDTWTALGLAELVGSCESIRQETLPDGSRRISTVVTWKGEKPLKVEGHDKSTVKVTEMQKPSRPVTLIVASVWNVAADGTVSCSAKIRPLGKKFELPRIGFAFEMAAEDPHVAWLGRGPFENYRDRKSGAFVGYWQSSAFAFFVPYARNEDCGNREDTYGFSVGDLAMRTLGEPFAFEVNPYTPLELLRTVHPPELPASDKTFVGIFAETRGLGGQSCGPAPMPRDVIRTDRDYDLAFTLELGADELTPRAGDWVDLPVLPEASSLAEAKVVLCSSAEPGEGPGEHVLDGDLNTIWHTQYTGTQGNFPHILTIELQKVEKLRGLRVYGRRNGVNGRVKDCSVETSRDGKNDWTIVAETTLRNTHEGQDILFNAPVEAKFYRFTALNNHYGNDFASMAEIEILK